MLPAARGHQTGERGGGGRLMMFLVFPGRTEIFCTETCYLLFSRVVESGGRGGGLCWLWVDAVFARKSPDSGTIPVGEKLHFPIKMAIRCSPIQSLALQNKFQNQALKSLNANVIVHLYSLVIHPLSDFRNVLLVEVHTCGMPA